MDDPLVFVRVSDLTREVVGQLLHLIVIVAVLVIHIDLAITVAIFALLLRGWPLQNEGSNRESAARPVIAGLCGHHYVATAAALLHFYHDCLKNYTNFIWSKLNIIIILIAKVY